MGHLRHQAHSLRLPPPLPSQANSEEFIPIFANNPRELKAFLEHMSAVQPDSPQGIYDTLLELRLQNWAHEKDPQVRLGKLQEVLEHRPFFHLLWLLWLLLQTSPRC